MKTRNDKMAVHGCPSFEPRGLGRTSHDLSFAWYTDADGRMGTMLPAG